MSISEPVVSLKKNELLFQETDHTLNQKREKQ